MVKFLRRNDHPQIPPPFPKVVRNVFFSFPGMWWGVVCRNINGFLKHIINMYYYVQVSFLFVLMLWISYRLKRHQDTSSLTVPTIGCKTFVIPSCLNWCWTMGWTLEKRDVVGFGYSWHKNSALGIGEDDPILTCQYFSNGWLNHLCNFVSEHLKQICPVI